jgi:hypothetical protein
MTDRLGLPGTTQRGAGTCANVPVAEINGDLATGEASHALSHSMCAAFVVSSVNGFAR